MNRTHINRFWVENINLWCVDNLGTSIYYNSTPRIILNHKPNSKLFGFLNLRKIQLLYLLRNITHLDYLLVLLFMNILTIYKI